MVPFSHPFLLQKNFLSPHTPGSLSQGDQLLLEGATFSAFALLAIFVSPASSDLDGLPSHCASFLFSRTRRNLKLPAEFGQRVKLLRVRYGNVAGKTLQLKHHSIGRHKCQLI